MNKSPSMYESMQQAVQDYWALCNFGLEDVVIREVSNFKESSPSKFKGKLIIYPEVEYHAPGSKKYNCKRGSLKIN